MAHFFKKNNKNSSSLLHLSTNHVEFEAEQNIDDFAKNKVGGLEGGDRWADGLTQRILT